MSHGANTGRRGIEALLGATLVVAFVGSAQGKATGGLPGGEKPEFSRYQVIMDRKPFGALLPSPTQVTPPAPPGVPLSREWKMVAIWDEPEGVRAGFVGLAAKPGGAGPESYMVRVGEVFADVTLVSADYDEERALLRKGSQEEWLSMRDGASAGGTSGAGTPVLSAGARMGATRAYGPGVSRAPAAGSYAARLKQRQEAQAKRNAELMAAATNAARPSPADMEKHLQDYNLKLIRAKGEMGPPLPIPLTPEQDEQLVKEGVLPPVTE